MTRMVDESLELKEQVFWYSTMVGKKTTLKQVFKIFSIKYDISVDQDIFV